MARAVILHTADLHNRLTPAAGCMLGELRRERPGTLLLDAGDAVSAGNLTFRVRGEPILRLMSEVGYDAMAMGNRESHPKRALLVRKLRDARFPVLAANLVTRRKAPPPVIRDCIVFEGSPCVAVIGLAPQITRPRSLWAAVTDFVFEDPVSVAARLAAELEEIADLVVCLSHCGRQVDLALAALPEVDLVLGGHSHEHVMAQESGRAMVVHPGRFGSHVARTVIAGRDDSRAELLSLENSA